MPDKLALENRVATLEAAVRALQESVAVLAMAVKTAQPSSGPELKSRGMLDRPKPRK
jgi:hypothetical protein